MTSTVDVYNETYVKPPPIAYCKERKASHLFPEIIFDR